MLRDRAHANEWYADGLQFQCTQCGNCCTGPPGYVWISKTEARAMAVHLGLSEQEFREQYAHQIHGRWSLIEKLTEHGHDCIFLDRDTIPGRAVCGIYEARPSQCRTWPFWPSNLKSKQAWDRTKKLTPCPGMDHGPSVAIHQIRIQRDATPDV